LNMVVVPTMYLRYARPALRPGTSEATARARAAAEAGGLPLPLSPAPHSVGGEA